MNELVASFKAGPVYTFAFWGISRFLDVINWKVVGIPIATPIDFNQFAGGPPVHLVLYSLEPPADGGQADERHVQSRKKFYFRGAVWSSQKRPDRARFEALTGTAHPAG